MSTFKLEISTPEAEFLSVDAEAVTMSSRKGSMTVLPGHAPMLVALTPGEINVKVEGKWRAFLSMDGFVEVTGDQVVMYTRAAVWEDEAEAHRSAKEKQEALERIRVQKSIFEHNHTKIELTRAMSRLGKGRKNRNM